MGKIDDVELEVRLVHEIYPALLKDSTYQQLSKRHMPNAMSRILITFTNDDLKTLRLALLELGNNSDSGLEEVSTEELVAYLIKYIALYSTLDYMAWALKNRSWQSMPLIGEKDAELLVDRIVSIDLSIYGIYFNYRSDSRQVMEVSMALAFTPKITNIEAQYLDWPFTIHFFARANNITAKYDNWTLRTWTVNFIYEKVSNFLIDKVGI